MVQATTVGRRTPAVLRRQLTGGASGRGYDQNGVASGLATSAWEADWLLLGTIRHGQTSLGHVVMLGDLADGCMQEDVSLILEDQYIRNGGPKRS